MLILTKLIYKTKLGLLLLFCLGNVGLYLTVRELCHHQNPFRFAFSLCPFGALSTLLSSFCSFAFPHLFIIIVTHSEAQLVGVDGRWNMAQTCSGAIPERTCNLWNSRVSVNETFHLRVTQTARKERGKHH